MRSHNEFHASICQAVTCIILLGAGIFIILYQINAPHFHSKDLGFTKVIHKNCSNCPDHWMFPPQDVLCKVN